jgi:5-carboxymethyl-2-hydroxymuconate isomerase
MCGQDAEVARPQGISTLDYEPELVFVIGKRAHRVAKAGALDHIAGITVFNDVTAREIQKREVASGSRFWTAKNMPGFAPIGPFIATLDEVADVDNLWITCDVNGERRLRENTSQFIFKIADVIEHFTRYVVFEPGDLIAMGAPKGVAMGQLNATELYLKPGDLMEIGIEGLMSLRTRIVAAA